MTDFDRRIIVAIGLFYSTLMGSTKETAESIRALFGDDVVQIFDIGTESTARLAEFEKLIFGVPTMGYGELSDEWKAWIDTIHANDIRGKTIAIFGFGDQSGYPDTFVDAMGIVRDKLVECEAVLVGQWPADDYVYEWSKAEHDGVFAGLALDNANQPEMTGERTRAWVESIRNSFV